jgi:hypothetical protein
VDKVRNIISFAELSLLSRICRLATKVHNGGWCWPTWATTSCNTLFSCNTRAKKWGGQSLILLRHNPISFARGTGNPIAPITVDLERGNSYFLTSSSIRGSGAAHDETASPWSNGRGVEDLRLIDRRGHK